MIKSLILVITKLFYYINKLIYIYYLYIFLLIALNILAIACGKSHLGFVWYYKIINHS